MIRSNASRLVVLVATLAVCVVPLSARAGVIGAEQYFETVDRQAALGRVDAVLTRADVAAELNRLGVDPEDAMARAEALSDSELRLLANDLENLPAGGSLLGTVGVVFVVLIILELVGVIDIFRKI